MTNLGLGPTQPNVVKFGSRSTRPNMTKFNPGLNVPNFNRGRLDWIFTNTTKFCIGTTPLNTTKFGLVHFDLQSNLSKNLDWKWWLDFFGLSIFENLDLEMRYPIHKIYKMYIRLKSKSNKMNFKWIGFVIKWILNGFDQSKSILNQKNWIFFPPYKALLVGTHVKKLYYDYVISLVTSM